MKNLQKISLGLIAIFSFTACSSGTKVTRDEFFEAVAKLKSPSYKNAKVAIEEVEKREENSDISESKSTLSGNFKKDNTFDTWVDTWEADENTSLRVERIFKSILSDMNLSTSSETRNGFETYKSFAEEKYYIKPFLYDSYYKDDDYDHIDYTSLKEKYSTVVNEGKTTCIENYHYEWDKCGYLTFAERKTEIKYEYKTTKSKETTTCTIKVSYK
ncbi:MAG: hypothetical protein K6E21_01765 [Bacilli bacterium]|nr:hypothetical protein [Bacilli bacterium]